MRRGLRRDRRSLCDAWDGGHVPDDARLTLTSNLSPAQRGARRSRAVTLARRDLDRCRRGHRLRHDCDRCRGRTLAARLQQHDRANEFGDPRRPADLPCRGPRWHHGRRCLRPLATARHVDHRRSHGLAGGRRPGRRCPRSRRDRRHQAGDRGLCAGAELRSRGRAGRCRSPAPGHQRRPDPRCRLAQRWSSSVCSRRHRVRALERAARFVLAQIPDTSLAGGLPAPRSRRLLWSTSAPGALLVAGSLVMHHGEVETISRQVGGGWGGVPILVLGVLAAPNAIIYSIAYLAGPGFALGTGTSVSLTSTAHGTLPAFPLLGAVPSGHGANPAGLGAGRGHRRSGRRCDVRASPMRAGSLAGALRTAASGALIIAAALSCWCSAGRPAVRSATTGCAPSARRPGSWARSSVGRRCAGLVALASLGVRSRWSVSSGAAAARRSPTTRTADRFAVVARHAAALAGRRDRYGRKHRGRPTSRLSWPDKVGACRIAALAWWPSPQVREARCKRSSTIRSSDRGLWPPAPTYRPARR